MDHLPSIYSVSATGLSHYHKPFTYIFHTSGRSIPFTQTIYLYIPHKRQVYPIYTNHLPIYSVSEAGLSYLHKPFTYIYSIQAVSLSYLHKPSTYIFHTSGRFTYLHKPSTYIFHTSGRSILFTQTIYLYIPHKRQVYPIHTNHLPIYSTQAAGLSYSHKPSTYIFHTSGRSILFTQTIYLYIPHKRQVYPIHTSHVPIYSVSEAGLSHWDGWRWCWPGQSCLPWRTSGPGGLITATEYKAISFT